MKPSSLKKRPKTPAREVLEKGKTKRKSIDATKKTKKHTPNLLSLAGGIDFASYRELPPSTDPTVFKTLQRTISPTRL